MFSAFDMLYSKLSRGALNMSKSANALLSYPTLLWARFTRFIQARADQEVANWGSSLQYKRRYTNPDTAKRYRQPV